MKTIHLVLKHKWFVMIASGYKEEEYREIKPYYERRLKDLKKGDRVVFHKGYTSIIINAEVKYCYKGFGYKSWGGDPDRLQWVIGISVPHIWQILIEIAQNKINEAHNKY